MKNLLVLHPLTRVCHIIGSAMENSIVKTSQMKLTAVSEHFSSIEHSNFAF